MSDLSGKYKVHLGGRDRGLRYTWKDMDQLEKMFPRPDGTPGDLTSLIQGHLIESGSFSVRSTLLWKGLHTVNNKITLAKVQEWLEKHVKEGSALKVIYIPTLNAFAESGVLGQVIEDAFGQEVDEGEDEAPKAKGGSQPKS